MTTDCNLGKWRLFIRFLEKNPSLAKMIIGTACICAIMAFYFCGEGFKQGSKVFTEKSLKVITNYVPESIAN